MISSSAIASILMVFYIVAAVYNLYKLMYPLAMIDVSTTAPDRFVKPLWKPNENLRVTVFLSSRDTFDIDFLQAEFPSEETDDLNGAAILLWKEEITSASLSKSFLLTTLNCDRMECENDQSYQYSKSWLDRADQLEQELESGGILSIIKAAGQGVESTSFLLTIYQSLSNQIKSLLSSFSSKSSSASKNDGTERKDANNNIAGRSIIQLPSSSPLWSTLMSNSTLYMHVLTMRREDTPYHITDTPQDYEQASKLLLYAHKSNSLLFGQVDLVKYEAPHHLSQPGRILFYDIAYLFRHYILQSSTETERPPWDMEYSKPTYYQAYQMAQKMKEEGSGYPYWKPEVAVKYLLDTDEYPFDLSPLSGMELIRLSPKHAQDHPTMIAHLPTLHVDEIGLTSEKYIPVNSTLTSLPLRITFDRSDVKETNPSKSQTATAGGISPARWRLLSHLSEAIESQKDWGVEQTDIDDIRRLIADTNITLLMITMLASVLHLLFEFLTFKNDVSFWKNNTDLTGLSVRSVFLDMLGQVVVLLFLIEKDSSLLMTVPSACGWLIALWKCQRASGLAFVKVKHDNLRRPSSKLNGMLRTVTGYELRATRLELSTGETGKDDDAATMSETQKELHALTMESDRIATATLGVVLLPLVVIFTIYSLLYEEHTGWYSWLITSASSAVYALGFALMTPQLFLNYKLKSVAHLPWRVLIYKSLNTFIDDLFSFIIRMPTMARISCFRDDVVFFVYLYQRWLYPVDILRPIEGGDTRTQEEKRKAASDEKSSKKKTNTKVKQQ